MCISHVEDVKLREFGLPNAFAVIHTQYNQYMVSLDFIHLLSRSLSVYLICSTLFTGWMPTILRAGRGMTLWEKARRDQPPEMLELFSYENNPVRNCNALAVVYKGPTHNILGR